MEKTKIHGWKRQGKSIKRIIFAIILALIIFFVVGCRGRHWGGGHDNDGYGRNGGRGCSNQFFESVLDIV